MLVCTTTVGKKYHMEGVMGTISNAVIYDNNSWETLQDKAIFLKPIKNKFYQNLLTLNMTKMGFVHLYLF